MSYSFLIDGLASSALYQAYRENPRRFREACLEQTVEDLVILRDGLRTQGYTNLSSVIQGYIDERLATPKGE